MNATDTRYTIETQVINDVEVTVYGGHTVKSYSLAGHHTSWRKRAGARTTYAELTCVCHLAAEAIAYPGEQSWISYGEDGWVERLEAVALAHVENVTANGFMVRPAKGDRSRWADRTRTDRAGLFIKMQEAGLRYSEVMGHIEDVEAGHIVTAEDGTRFELAQDRAPYARERLPIR